MSEAEKMIFELIPTRDKEMSMEDLANLGIYMYERGRIIKFKLYNGHNRLVVRLGEK